jgi:DNA polymerase-3 subunit beta
VFLDIGESKIHATVATDARVIATQRFASTSPPEKPVSAIVPLRAAQIIARLFDCDDEASVSISDNAILVRRSGTSLYSQLMSGRFMKWRKAIPSRKSDFCCTAESMISIICNAVISADDEFCAIDVNAESGTLSIRGSGESAGESVADMPIDYDGPKLTVRVKGGYMIDVLKAVPPESTVDVSLGNGDEGIVIQTSDGYVSVIMPLSKGRD